MVQRPWGRACIVSTSFGIPSDFTSHYLNAAKCSCYETAELQILSYFWGRWGGQSLRTWISLAQRCGHYSRQHCQGQPGGQVFLFRFRLWSWHKQAPCNSDSDASVSAARVPIGMGTSRRAFLEYSIQEKEGSDWTTDLLLRVPKFQKLSLSLYDRSTHSMSFG